MYVYLFCLLGLILTSCQNNTSYSSKYYEDGRAKPTVSLVPVIDSSSFDYPWSLSEEFTLLVSDKIIEKQILHLPKEGIIQGDFSYEQDLFNTDLTWMKNHFPNEEFVAFVEFLKHDQSPLDEQNLHETSSNIKLLVRIRVVDLRKTKPHIVLQETLSDSYFLSKTHSPFDYQTYTWGTEGYEHSPLFAAHRRLASQIADRISDYVTLAKSR